MKLRALALVLVLAMLSGLMPVYAAEVVASGYCGSTDGNYLNVQWTLDSDGKLTVSGTGEMGWMWYAEDADGVVTGFAWASHRDEIRTAVIEEGVTSVGSFMFYDCENLVSVSIPSSVTKIGQGAFSYCKILSELNIPDTVTEIESELARESESLTTVHLPSGLTAIPDYAFSGCKALKSAPIPDSVTMIGKDAFYKCYALEGVRLPKGILSIGEYAFYYCMKLSNIELPEGLRRIGAWAFSNCSLESVVIPSSIREIENGAFSDNRDLYTISLPDKLTRIGDSAFYGSHVHDFHMPMTVTEIGSYAFYDCSFREVVIPSGVTEIGSYAFAENEGLEKVLILSGVESVGERAFSGSGGDKERDDNGYVIHRSEVSVYIPATVTSIGNYALYAVLEGVYYGGSKEQWDELMKNAAYVPYEDIVHYGASSRSVDVRYQPGYYISPMDFGDIVLNGPGDASAYFQVETENHLVAGGAKLEYCFVNGSQAGVFTPVTADRYGIVEVKLPHQTKVGHNTYRIWFSTANRIEVFDDDQEVSVTVNEPSYGQFWEATADLGVEGGVGSGVGGKIGPAEAKAEYISASLQLGAKTAVSLEEEYENGVRSLTLKSAGGLNGGLKVSSGVKAKLSESLNVTPLEATMGGTVGAFTEYGMKLENYDPTDREQRAGIRTFLIYHMLGSTSVFTQMFVQALDPECNQIAGTRSVTVKNKLEALKAGTDNGFKGSLSSLGETTVWTQTEAVDLTGSDASRTFTNGVVTDVGAGLLSGSHTTEGKAGAVYTVGTSNYIFGRSLSNHKEVSVVKDDSDVIVGASYKVYDGDEHGLIFPEYSTDVYSKVSYSGDSIETLVNTSQHLRGVSDGNMFAGIQGAIDELSSSDLIAQVKETTKKKTGLEGDFPVSFQMGEKLGIEVGLSGEWSYSWDDKTSALYLGKEYVKTTSDLTAEDVRGKLVSLPSIVGDALRAIASDAVSGIKAVGGKIGSGVGDTYNTIRRHKTDPYSYWFARITDFVEEEEVRRSDSYAIVSLMDEDSEVQSVSATIGAPVLVTVYTDESCETVVSDEELAAAAAAGNPVELVMRYTDEMLEQAGMWVDETVPEVMMFRYDRERGCYIRVEGVNDRDARTVTASLTRNGEYILALDSVAPIIEDVCQITDGLSPTFTMKLSDLSGIESFRLWLEKGVDGEEDWSWVKVGDDLIITDTLTQFFDPESGTLELTIPQTLESDVSYRLCYRAADRLGNETEEDVEAYTFSVNRDEMAAGQLTVPEGVANGNEPFTVTFPDLGGVVHVSLLLKAGDTELEPIDMVRTPDGWTAVVRPVSGAGELTLTALTFDCYGNTATSEPAVVALESPANEGTMGDDQQLEWSFDPKLHAVTVNDIKKAPVLGEGSHIIAVAYSEDGQMLSATIIDRTGGDAMTDPNAAAVKLFWITDSGEPLCGVNVIETEER